MNIVEFALKMRDLASQPLRKFGANSAAAFKQANLQADQLTSHNRVLGQSIDKLQQNFEGVNDTVRKSTIVNELKKAREELDALKEQSKDISPDGILPPVGGGLGVTGLLKGLGIMELAKGAASMIGNAIEAGVLFSREAIDKSLERQQLQTTFNVLTGSEAAGSALTKQLADMQKDTILGSEVFDNAQMMLGFGFKNTEILDDLKMLGDVSMGDAQRLNSLTLAFSQVRAGGKLVGNDLIQFVNAEFNPLNEMMKTTGKSYEQLKDDMSKGRISFDMVRQAFKDATGEGGRFNNMLAKIAETPVGKMKQLDGAWDEFKISVGTAFMPLVSMALNLANKVLPIIEKIIKPLTTGVQKIAALIGQATGKTGNWGYYVNELKSLFVNYIEPAIRRTFEVIGHIVKEMILFVSHSEIVKGIFDLIVINIKTSALVLELIMKQVKMFFDTVIRPNLMLAETLYRLVKPGKSNFQKIEKVEFKPLKKTEETNAGLLGATVANAVLNGKAGKENESIIAGGGQKVINISVAKFLDYITINPISMKEGEADIERIFMELFGRVITQAGQ
jgi:tape measure domain-containing protein